jgi:hypothetical protein
MGTSRQNTTTLSDRRAGRRTKAVAPIGEAILSTAKALLYKVCGEVGML